MSYKEEFPHFELDVQIPDGFEDNSWHNDVCPNWIKNNSDGSVINLWIDYKNPEEREMKKGKRFMIFHFKNDEDLSIDSANFSYHGNDYNVILKMIEEFSN